ncbi:MAG: hypothetical protein PHV36_06180 [Elusimicrobiales bacterium]|nr:hypothetical protein [Elusimicrobiales bacterium]
MIHYPSPADVLKTESAALKLLGDSPFLQGNHYNFARAASDAHRRLEGIDLKKFKDGPLIVFEGLLEISISNKPYRIFLGEIINTKREKKDFFCCDASLYMAIADSSGDVIRKFHFDYDSGRNKTGKEISKKPYLHLQYGGELSRQMKAAGIDDSKYENAIRPWMENPRICFYPISIFMLVYMIFTEFIPEDAHKLFEDTYWQHRLEENEATFLRPFLGHCASIKGNKSLLKEHFYHH